MLLALIASLHGGAGLHAHGTCAHMHASSQPLHAVVLPCGALQVRTVPVGTAGVPVLLNQFQYVLPLPSPTCTTRPALPHDVALSRGGCHACDHARLMTEWLSSHFPMCAFHHSRVPQMQVRVQCVGAGCDRHVRRRGGAEQRQRLPAAPASCWGAGGRGACAAHQPDAVVPMAVGRQRRPWRVVAERRLLPHRLHLRPVQPLRVARGPQRDAGVRPHDVQVGALPVPPASPWQQAVASSLACRCVWCRRQ